jgi:hypothetical protein
MAALLLQAVELMQKRGFSQNACSTLVTELLAYVAGRAPFDLACGLSMRVKDWWAAMPDARAAQVAGDVVIQRVPPLLPIRSVSFLCSASLRGSAAARWALTPWA